MCRESLPEYIIKPPASTFDHDTLKLFVNSSFTPKNLAEGRKTQQLFEQRLIKALKDKSRYKNITLVKEPSTNKGELLMIVTINYVHSVSGGARVLGGAFSGAASFKTKVVLYQDDAKNRIGEMICGTTSKSSQGIFGADTNHQITIVAEKIAMEFAP